MTLGSLFDGSGTCPLAAAMCGITPVWASEIEPYPIRVTQKNFPRMKHLGDITQINGAEIEPVDIVTFGSPCQDLSEAGAQKGLVDGKRSRLFFDALRIICEMREATNGKYPRYAVWENVPGAFSSNKGRDFLIVYRESPINANRTAIYDDLIEQQRVAISAVKTCRQLKKALFDKKNVTDKELVSLVLQLKSGRCEDRGGTETEEEQ